MLNLAEQSDEELMVLYQSGNEKAFHTLYDRHFEKVFNFVQSRVRNEEKALDICQETFIRLHRHRDLYKGHLPFLPWLFTITKNTMLNKLNQFSREKENVVYDDELVSKAESPAPIEMDDISGFLEGLPDQQRNAIHLRYVDEKSFEEIAEILNTSSLNVRQIISRGLKRLKTLTGKGLKV